jgi:hypothetical protein
VTTVDRVADDVPSRPGARRRAVIAVLLAFGVQVAVQAVAVEPAFALGRLGLVLVATTLDDYDDRHNSNSAQTRSASCPTGTHVVGGGARVSLGSDKVRLTRLVPVRGTNGGADYFSATAEEPDTGYASEWQFYVYAICADVDELDNYSIVSAATTETSTGFKQATVDCPGSTLAIGGGAAITNANNQVGLQLSRLASALDIARATGREDADGYALSWGVTAYAICADRIDSAAIYGTIVAQSDTEECPPDKFVHSVGGGGGLTDSGPYFLQTIYPITGLRSWTVAMTGPPVSQVVVNAVCAY